MDENAKMTEFKHRLGYTREVVFYPVSQDFEPAACVVMKEKHVPNADGTTRFLETERIPINEALWREIGLAMKWKKKAKKND